MERAWAVFLQMLHGSKTVSAGALGLVVVLLAGLAWANPATPGASGYHVLKTIPVGGTEGWDYVTSVTGRCPCGYVKPCLEIDRGGIHSVPRWTEAGAVRAPISNHPLLTPRMHTSIQPGHGCSDQVEQRCGIDSKPNQQNRECDEDESTAPVGHRNRSSVLWWGRI
jgi:hypothetical protein